jgi:phosphoglucomutase
MDYMEMYNRWLGFDEDTKAELTGLEPNEVQDRFYKELEFGTGGLRGVIGAGTNRMNVYTVRKATQGLADYIKNQGVQNPSVAIAYDSRRFSEVFAREAGLVLCANSIKAYVYNELKPTPMLSFAVRKLGCTAGIVLTASHNPKEYNGYKAYWSDGCQVAEERADGILKCILDTDYSNIKTMDYDEAVAEGMLCRIPQYVEDDYINRVKELSINKEVLMDAGDSLKIVYTPLNGTGNKPVRRILMELGFKNVYVVAQQENPDPEFSTLKYPNPEEHDAFTLAIKLAKQECADIIIGTDPDCDRIGVVVKNHEGEYQVLTGNQTGSLLTYYMLSQLRNSGRMPQNPMVIKTIVTTEMARTICKDFNVELIDVLTGFKYIGEKIEEFIEKKKFLLGYEESYGYLAGSFVRDKDAVIAAALICEMAAFYKLKGMSLYDALIDLYEKYGYYRESLQSLTMKGIEGNNRIQEIMKNLRENTPDSIMGIKVIRVKDYLKSQEKDCRNGATSPINLPNSNVIQLILEDRSMVTARPSGTEPKIKFYFASIGRDAQEADNKLNNLKQSTLDMVK